MLTSLQLNIALTSVNMLLPQWMDTESVETGDMFPDTRHEHLGNMEYLHNAYTGDPDPQYQREIDAWDYCGQSYATSAVDDVAYWHYNTEHRLRWFGSDAQLRALAYTDNAIFKFFSGEKELAWFAQFQHSASADDRIEWNVMSWQERAAEREDALACYNDMIDDNGYYN